MPMTKQTTLKTNLKSFSKILAENHIKLHNDSSLISQKINQALDQSIYTGFKIERGVNVTSSYVLGDFCTPKIVEFVAEHTAVPKEFK